MVPEGGVFLLAFNGRYLRSVLLPLEICAGLMLFLFVVFQWIQSFSLYTGINKCKVKLIK